MIMVVEAFTHGVLARQSVNASDNLTKMSNKGPEAQRATGRVANFCSGAGAQSAERRVLSYDIALSPCPGMFPAAPRAISATKKDEPHRGPS